MRKCIVCLIITTLMQIAMAQQETLSFLTSFKSGTNRVIHVDNTDGLYYTEADDVSYTTKDSVQIKCMLFKDTVDYIGYLYKKEGIERLKKGDRFLVYINNIKISKYEEKIEGEKTIITCLDAKGTMLLKTSYLSSFNNKQYTHPYLNGAWKPITITDIKNKNNGIRLSFLEDIILNNGEKYNIIDFINNNEKYYTIQLRKDYSGDTGKAFPGSDNANQEDILEINGKYFDTVLSINDIKYVKGVLIDIGTKKALYLPPAGFQICYFNVLIAKLNGTLKLDLDKVKLIDNDGAEHTVFGVTTSDGMMKIDYNTRTETTGGKTADIDLSEEYVPNASCIDIKKVIMSYNLGGNTVRNLGSISVNAYEKGVYTVSTGDQGNFMVFSKTPSNFLLVFIVPSSSKKYKILVDQNATVLSTNASITKIGGNTILAPTNKTTTDSNKKPSSEVAPEVRPMDNSPSAGTKYSSTIYVYRQFSLLGAAVKWGVSLDNSIVANLSTNEYVVLHVTPGNHTVVIGGSNIDLLVPGDNAAINAIINGNGSFSVKANDTAFIRSKGAKVQFVQRNAAFEDMTDMECKNCGPNERPIAAPQQFSNTNGEKPSSEKPIPAAQNMTIERWPHKGSVNLKLAIQLSGAMTGVQKIIDAENSYLKELGLYETQTNSSGQVISTKPIINYDYTPDNMMGGARAEYSLSNTFGLGLHFFTCQYNQDLTIKGDVGSGDIISVYVLGPSLTKYLFQKNRFGVSLIGDLGYVFGAVSSLPALDSLRKMGTLNEIPGLSALIQSKHTTADLSGIQGDVIISANWFIVRWFSLDAGVSLYFFAANLNKQVWPNTPTTINSIKPALYVGINFHLFNHQPK